MNKRSQHTGKSYKEKENYNRYIKKIDYDPTIEEQLNLRPSYEPDKMPIEYDPNAKRKKSFATKVGRHFQEHWIEYFVSIAVIIGLYFMVNAKIDIARFGVVLDNQNEDIKEIKQDLKDIEKSNNNQENLIKENSYRIQNIENNQKAIN